VKRVRYGGYDYAATADFGLLRAAAEAAEAKGIEVKVGNVHSADLFYNPDPEAFDRMEEMGVLAVEMEAAGLYGAAAAKRARALTICTVSDHVRTGESTSSEERQQTFDEMVMIALEAVKIDAAS
jgi:purine-nucleoside phosphorylase